jgi:hypothetical protein
MAITWIDKPDSPTQSKSKIEYIDEPTAKPSISPFTAYDVAQEFAPANIVRQHTLEPMGEGIAEALGRRGHPKIGAAVGTAVQIAPELLSTALGLKGIYKSTDPAVKGALNTTKELGEDFAAQNDAIGVARRVPPEGGAKPQYAPFERVAATKQPTPVVPAEPVPSNVPVRYPSKAGDFMAYARGRLGSAKGVDPQELMDWQVKLQTDLNNGTIPKIDQATGRITTIYQQATDLLSKTKAAFNDAAEAKLPGANLPEGVMPTRSGLNQAFSRAADREQLGRTVKQGAKWAAGLGGGAYGIKALIDALGNRP